MWQLAPDHAPAGLWSPPAPESRAAARHCYRRPPPARLQVRSLLRTRAALVRDLSADGAGLLLAEPVEPGTALLIQLHGPAPAAALTLAARAVHATRQGDGHWLVGCRLAARLRAGDWARALRLDG